MKAKVSVIILNLNGKEHLKECLSSLLEQSYKNIEIIVVDNGSVDGSAEFVKTFYPQVKLIENKENLGFTRGNNQGAKKASGKYLLFLNNDVRVDKNSLSNLVKALEKDKSIGMAQSKILSWDQPETIDSVGCYFTFIGVFWHEAYGEKDRGQFKEPKEVFGATGAALFISKSLFKKVGGFDDVFFIYFEDADLSWRVWRKGKRVALIPSSVVYHKHGATTSRNLPSSFWVFHTFKNSIYILLKNLDFRYLIFVLPTYLLLCLSGGFLYLLKLNLANFWAAYRGIFWNVANLSFILEKRKEARKEIFFPDDKIFSKVAKKLPLSYLVSWPRGYFKIWGKKQK